MSSETKPTVGDYVNFVTSFYGYTSTESAIWRIVETTVDEVHIEPIFFFVKPINILLDGGDRWVQWHQIRHVDIIDLASTRLQIDQLINEIIRRRSE